MLLLVLGCGSTPEEALVDAGVNGPSSLATSLRVVAPAFRKPKSSSSLVPTVFFGTQGMRTEMTVHAIDGHKAMQNGD